MLRVEYSQEASNFFYDNGRLTFELMIAIEGLVFSDGLPKVGLHIEAVPGQHTWTHLGYIVVYWIVENRLIVQVVIPVE